MAAYSKEALSLAEQPEYADKNADAIHYGNTVLGRIALRQGDVTAASEYLLKAAKIKRQSPSGHVWAEHDAGERAA